MSSSSWILSFALLMANFGVIARDCRHHSSLLGHELSLLNSSTLLVSQLDLVSVFFTGKVHETNLLEIRTVLHQVHAASVMISSQTP